MKIEEKVAGINPHRRRRIGMRKRTAISIFAVLGIALALTAGAALLTSFGAVKTTVNVEQSVLVNGLPWNEPTTHDLGDLYAGCCVYTKDKIENRGCVEGTLDFDTIITTPGNADDPTVKYYVIPGLTTLELTSKSNTWEPTTAMKATLTFNPCCPEFDYDLTVTGLTDGIEYALIYYADRDSRFSLWGGDNPGAVIGIFTATADPTIVSRSINLGMNLPSEPDWNIHPGDVYDGTPDNYPHWQGGAKLWIVPIADLTNRDSLPLVNWNPTTYLFETDLVCYFDCSLELPDWFSEVYTLPEDVTKYTIGPEESICLITQTCLDWAAYPGPYTVTTTVTP